MTDNAQHGAGSAPTNTTTTPAAGIPEAATNATVGGSYAATGPYTTAGPQTTAGPYATIGESYGTTTATYPAAAEKPARLFRRSRTDRMLGGVCGGLAEAIGVDAALLRIALVAATILGFGAGVVIYLACWLVVPEAGSSH